MCRWSFLQSADAVRKQEFSDTLLRASVKDLGVILMGAGYEVIFSSSCYVCYYLSFQTLLLFFFDFNDF